ncbi:regulatory protein GemA [Lysobacter yananisis]|uniref:Regulatory protein GemA n=1 Tax=Lysobacter yananisis TaxID=1003114 RepID=A0ABY9PAC8_9GAMM|nr:regulatory protein GemA [Lysobacter yananisis]WMT03343.1 regulatory protein GemA [Lysobacter yananisis]
MRKPRAPRTRTDQAAARRKRTLAAIHATATQLGLDEDVYRDLVQRVSAQHGDAQRSAGKCTPVQLDAIANELRRLAGKGDKDAETAANWPGRPKGALSPQVGKVEALLADSGRDWAYAHAVALRICRVSRVEWCRPDQLAKVIAALQIDADRRRRDPLTE